MDVIWWLLLSAFVAVAVLASAVLIGWSLRRRRNPRLVRVHMKAGEPSITGFLRGRFDGHYVLLVAKLHDEAEGVDVPLEGEISIPVGNVALMQSIVSVEPA